MIFLVDISAVCGILFSVMRDCPSLNENEVKELNFVIDEWQEAAITMQDVEHEEEEICWCKPFESCPVCFGRK